ncbi:maturase K [Bienertia sinuspersici]
MERADNIERFRCECFVGYPFLHNYPQA